MVLEFLRRHSETRADLVTEGRLVDIVAEGFDLGIRPADLVPRARIALTLGSPQRHDVVAALPGSPSIAESTLRPILREALFCLGVGMVEASEWVGVILPNTSGYAR